MKKEVFDILEEHNGIFAITFNLNDTFYYACADSSTIDVSDLEDMEDTIIKYGHSAIIAYEAIKRGHDPQIPNVVTSNFNLAKEDIMAIINSEKEEDKYKLYELRHIVESQKVREPLKPKERKVISKWISQSLDRVFSFFY